MPPAPAPERPVGVVFVSLGFLLLAGGAALLAVFLVALPEAREGIASAFSFLPAGVVLFRAFPGVAAAALLLFAALAAALARGLLRGRAWAWAGALLVAGLATLTRLADLARGDLEALLGLLVWGGLAYYLLRPEVRAYLRRA